MIDRSLPSNGTAVTTAPQGQVVTYSEQVKASPTSLNRVAARGGVTMGAAQLVKTFLQFLTVIVLARLLQPSDFGLVAAVAPLTSFVLLFQDLGLQQMLVQRQQITPAIISYVFWITSLVGLMCGLVMFCASPLVAWFYCDARLQPITAAAAIVVVGGSLSSSPMGMLNRTLRFGTMASITAAAAIASIVVAVITAFLGGRYWALISSSAASTLVILIASWRASRLQPGRPRLRPPEDGLLSFGAHMTSFSVLNYFGRNLDNVLVGRYVGSQALGYYDQAYKLLLFPLVIINSPLAQIMVPLLSKIQADKARLRAAYLRVVTLITLLAVPGVAAATIGSSDLILVLLGPKWAPVAPIFAWLGLAGLIQPLNSSTGWLFISQARTKAYLRWGVFNSSIAVLSFFVGLPWGAVGVATAYALSEYARTPFLYVVMGRIGPVSATDLLRVQAPPLIAALCTAGLMRGVVGPSLSTHSFARIFTTFFVSYVVTTIVTSLHAEGRAALREAKNLVGSTLLKRLFRG